VSLLPTVSSLLAAGDPGSTRLVYATIAGLVLIGVVLIALGVWLIRQTRVDLPVLAPLERMGDRDWRRQTDPATQRRILDEVRPEGAEPLTSEPSPPSLDAEFELAARPVASMSDLAPPAPETRAATPAGIERPVVTEVASSLPDHGPAVVESTTVETGAEAVADGSAAAPER
jgi:hypothetical protein